MPRKPKPKPAAVPATPAEPHPHYSEATERVFGRALATLAITLPEHEQALRGLFDDGALHDFASVERVLGKVER